jgi:hypothetical protein
MAGTEARGHHSHRSQESRDYSHRSW